jgi:hypothetical protein
MNSILQLVSPEALWKRSPYSELPAVPRDASDVIRHFFVVAGGIALLLSRCSAEGIARHYPRTNTLYRQIRAELRKGSAVSANAHLLSDVMHEVAEHADPTTRASLRYCFDARCLYERAVEDATYPCAGGAHGDLPPREMQSNVKASRLESLRAVLELQADRV